MPDEVVIVTSCPLCLAPDEVQSMVTVEIDRPIAGGRTAIMICRSCALAVVEAVGKAEPALLSTLIFDSTPPTEAQAAKLTEETRQLAEEYLEGVSQQAESAELHEGEDSDDGTSTD